MNNPLLITYEYPPQHGGIGKYLEQEVKNFENKEENQVIIIHAQDYEMPLWPQWLPLVWKSRFLLKNNKCDSIWISHILPIGYIALIYKKIFKIPYRVYLHGLDLVCPRKSFWKSFWVRRILLNSDEIVVNSKATANLLAYYKIPVSLARVQYPRIEHTDASIYKKVGEGLRKKYEVGKKLVLLSIGRLVKRKGIDLVIQSLPKIWEQIPGLVYVVIGDGEERDNLRVIASEVTAERGNPVTNAQSDKHGIASVANTLHRNDNGIIFAGAVSDEEKYGWLSTCNCFILTPKDDADDFEGYGIVYKEAQMFDKPVIGSKVGGVPEAVGDDGILVEPNNVDEIIEKVIQNIK